MGREAGHGTSILQFVSWWHDSELLPQWLLPADAAASLFHDRDQGSSSFGSSVLQFKLGGLFLEAQSQFSDFILHKHSASDLYPLIKPFLLELAGLDSVISN